MTSGAPSPKKYRACMLIMLVYEVCSAWHIRQKNLSQCINFEKNQWKKSLCCCSPEMRYHSKTKNWNSVIIMCILWIFRGRRGGAPENFRFGPHKFDEKTLRWNFATLKLNKFYYTLYEIPWNLLLLRQFVKFRACTGMQGMHLTAPLAGWCSGGLPGYFKNPKIRRSPAGVRRG